MQAAHQPQPASDRRPEAARIRAERQRLASASAACCAPRRARSGGSPRGRRRGALRDRRRRRGRPIAVRAGRQRRLAGWLAGPLSGLGSRPPASSFQTLTLVMCGGYVLVLIGATSASAAGRSPRAIVAAHADLLLGAAAPLPGRVRLPGVRSHGRAARPRPLHALPLRSGPRPGLPFIGWPFQHSPYGPLFTLASYATAPLGLAGGLWALKAVSALASLAAVALIAARRSKARPLTAAGRPRSSG